MYCDVYVVNIFIVVRYGLFKSVVLCILVYMIVLNYMFFIEGIIVFMYYNVDMYICIEVIMVFIGLRFFS